MLANAKAVMKGAKWVETNPRAAAILSIEKHYIASNPELNATALGRLRYIPSISGGRDAIRTTAESMKRAGILKPDMDVAKATDKIYRTFPGVDDEWIKSLVVETVAMGQIQPDQDELVKQEMAAVGTPQNMKTCCQAALAKTEK